MKRIFLLVTIALASGCLLHCYAQMTTAARPVPSRSLSISAERTTVLIFPADICRVDIGSPDVVAKTVKVGNTEKVLRLKATKPDIPASSMHVFTDDGRVYPFDLSYNAQLVADTWDFTAGASILTATATGHGAHLLPAQVRQAAARLCNHPRTAGGPKVKSMGMKLTVQGIYIKGGVLFFHFLIRNRSRMPYQLDFGRYYIRDERTAKRTTLMEKEIHPLYEYRCREAALPSGGSMPLVVAFDQFTIANRKQFMVELYEKAGDRHLRCRIKGRHLLRAAPLPDSVSTIPPISLVVPGNGAH